MRKLRKAYLYKAMGEVEFDEIKKGDLFVPLKCSEDDNVNGCTLYHADEDAVPFNDKEVDPHSTMEVTATELTEMKWEKTE